jgi:hypothetical protein
MQPTNWAASMTKNYSHSANDTPQSAQTTAATNSTMRSKAHRGRLAVNDLKRWELHTTELIQTKVREFAKMEGLLVGEAAEVFLNLGIQSFLSTRGASVADEVDEVKPTLIRDIIRNINQHNSVPSPLDITICNPSNPDQTLLTQIKPLIEYSSRITIQPLSEPALSESSNEVVDGMPVNETFPFGISAAEISTLFKRQK